jgi:branched-chain amino acid transport system ATP-binding protein
VNGLEVRGLRVTFGGVRALDDVDLSVRAGERRAVVGPNGAGKSTLFNAIGGQIAPSAGTITLLETDVSRLPAPRRARLGLSRTWQITNLFNALTVRETVTLAVAANKPARRVFWRSLDRFPDVREESEALLEQWGLTELAAQKVENLGYGQQRLLEIVVALANRPSVLLLDEPTAGLSPPEAERMTRITSELPADVTLLIIEHDMAVAFALAESITVLVRGRVLATGSVEEIRRNPEVIEAYLGEDADAAAR